MFERLSECMLYVPHPCLMPMEAGKGALDSAGTGVTVASRRMDDGIWNRCPLQKQQEFYRLSCLSSLQSCFRDSCLIGSRAHPID